MCTAGKMADDGRVMRNLKSSAYQLTLSHVDGDILGLASVGNLVFVSIARQGVHVYRVDSNGTKAVGELSRPGITCHDLTSGSQHVTYIAEEADRLIACVHQVTSSDDVDAKATRPMTSFVVQRRAPIAVHSSLGLVFIGGAAWMSAWTSALNDNQAQFSGIDEKHVVVVNMQQTGTGNAQQQQQPTAVARWAAVEHSVAQFQISATTTTAAHQQQAHQSLLAVSDTRSDIRVYDVHKLSSAAGGPPVCVYRVDVDHVRNFRLVGPSCVAVFHRYEPNISFWNLAEQRTILCINVQDQTRKLSEEFAAADDDDDYVIESASGSGEEDDHVTAVTSLPIVSSGASDADHLLVYGTVSGCVFGMSVRRRSKVFSIPCPLPPSSPVAGTSSSVATRPLRGVAVVASGGQLVLAYDGCAALVTMNFDVDDPPDRPSTRCGHRPAVTPRT